ncbi:hypothetical protein SYNPS1DRAFT_20773 [Syncephalis pseudoplumigaleata]|uniref:Uncharacterized protein n=1 Tax=Syncephalis pseudoplumigaleata TaxID=1712513 RepID=A0A4P9Z5Q4_9FUNG|nr:hypothetical protein SYNPS1DRAFT_20773 [Syncephalis pseudoplumigaleata]|eukprot:RKP27798.1 hypothetical protein SYNPS1DRAFT_20773 [Syncephalis pseudoplumigaleata]
MASAAGDDPLLDSQGKFGTVRFSRPQGPTRKRPIKNRGGYTARASRSSDAPASTAATSMPASGATLADELARVELEPSRQSKGGEASGLASRYFLGNEAEAEAEADAHDEPMLASRYFRGMADSIAATSIGPREEDGHRRGSPAAPTNATISDNSWPIRPLHEAAGPRQPATDRLEQSRHYAHELQTKLAEQSMRADRLDEEKRQLIDLAENQYIDKELPVKERRLAKIRQLAENMLKERERQHAMIERLKHEEMKGKDMDEMDWTFDRQRDPVPGLTRSVTWHENVEEVLYYNPAS